MIVAAAADATRPPTHILSGLLQAGQQAVQHVKAAAVDVGGKGEAELRDMLVKCASTSLNSKLVSNRHHC